MYHQYALPGGLRTGCGREEREHRRREPRRKACLGRRANTRLTVAYAKSYALGYHYLYPEREE